MTLDFHKQACAVHLLLHTQLLLVANEQAAPGTQRWHSEKLIMITSRQQIKFLFQQLSVLVHFVN